MLCKNEFFPHYVHIKNKIEVELDLFNYARKSDLINAAGVDPSAFPKKTDLGNLKLEVDQIDIDESEKAQSGLNNLKSKVGKLDVDKLVPVSTDLVKLNVVVKMKLLKTMCMMNWLKKLMLFRLLILVI